jgi:hypothetical protein
MDKARTKTIGETDKRILQRKLLSGEIAPKSLKAYFASLPDAADNAKEVVIPKDARRKSAKPYGSGDAD